jgi:superfamily II DNA or RNA helicase/HKD family nuclease
MPPVSDSPADNPPGLSPGPRDHLVTREVARLLELVEPELVDRVALDGVEGPRRLARHLASVVERELGGLTNDSEAARKQAAVVNGLLADQDAEAEVLTPPEIWTGLRERPAGLGDRPAALTMPVTPLASSDLLVNGPGQPNIGSELRAELASADSVDLLCAFVIRSGVVQLRDALSAAVDRDARVRVITTTYMGATQRKAVDELVRLGAEVRVAFDARTTKLHAKAWLIGRQTGLTTAFIGSSNLSHTALFDGLEWNVRLSAVDAPHVIERVRAMFESHWASEHFESYDPARDGERLESALGSHAARETGAAVSFVGLDVRPYPHQERILDRLSIERDRHDRHRNLVVAATGTGKTVVAALDYDRLCKRHGRQLTLLFVAHREQILHQARATFRHVLRDGSFGEIHGGGAAASGSHAFAMVQSLDAETVERLEPSAFDVVIVDEFHHAAAPTYRRLLERVSPIELVGLTATPERMDAQDITAWFGGRIAFEMRLWEAIDEGFLVPFQYFGVADGTDLSTLAWRRGGYASDALADALTGDHARVVQLLGAMERLLIDPRAMRALGFCVSVAHAHFMARVFNERGLTSIAIDGTTPEDERKAALRSLAVGELRCVFSVDVLGEGVDVPVVDTVLLLRPTDSATVFTQQMGRGLRRAPDKAQLTVIDLIGQQHREFRFDRRLTALLDIRRGPIREQVESGFPFLPSGCHVELDRQSTEIVLENLRSAARLRLWRTLVDDLRAYGDVSLTEFLSRSDRAPSDVYRGADHSWTALRRAAGLPAAGPTDAAEELALLRSIGRMLHVDDPDRIRLYREVFASHGPPLRRRSVLERRMLLMLHFAVWGTTRRFGDLEEGFAALWRHRSVRDEMVELFDALDDRSNTLPRSDWLSPETPLRAHVSYSRDEILGAYAVGSPDRPPQVREGIKYVADAASDLFFITLKKSDREYSPTTMYRDYAISRDLFHWESQATQSAGSPTIRRYVEHEDRGHSIVLFVRERKRTADGVTAPYVCLGPATYVESSGDRPVSFRWRLETPMPEDLFEIARSVAAV